MPQPLARLVCAIPWIGHQPSNTLAVMFGFDHPVCKRCGHDCPRS
jgi:hypothetical protein